MFINGLYMSRYKYAHEHIHMHAYACVSGKFATMLIISRDKYDSTISTN